MFFRSIILGFLVLTNSILVADVVKLNKGWNLLGSGIDLNVTTFSDADTIWKSQDGIWKVSSPNGYNNVAIENSGYETFDKIGKNEGFWVSVNNDINITLDNSVVLVDQNISLKNGWNLVGSAIDVNVGAFFEANVIWKYNDKRWEVASPNGYYSVAIEKGGYTTFNQINKNKGFWVSVNSDLNITLIANGDFSVKVEEGVARLNALNIETTSLTDTLEIIKPTLGTQNRDELVFSALIDIADIINSSDVQNLLETNSTLPNLDIFTGNTEVMAKIAIDATMLGGTDVMHTMATTLKNASDVLGAAFTDSTKVMNYNNFTFNATDARAVRAAALSAASALDLFASYTYGDISYFRTKTDDVDGISYEYNEGEIDPLAMLSQDTFFKIQNTDRLAVAGNYLKEATNLMSTVDVTKLTDNDTLTVTDIADATNLKTAFDGNGTYIFQEFPRESVNIKKVFNSIDYIDRNDFTLPTTYLGKSAEAIAEYEKALTYNKEQLAYNLSECRGDNNVTQPTYVEINYALIYDSAETTPVTFNRNESIKVGEPVYRQTAISTWLDWGNCTVIQNNWSNYSNFEAQFEPTFNSSFSDVVILASHTSSTVIQVSEAMLVGKVFYDTFNDSEYGNIIYGKMTINSDSTVTRHEMTLDSAGNIVSQWSETMSYTLPNGVIAVDPSNGSIKTFTLNSTTATTWNLTNENNIVIIWDITGTKPSAYPSSL